MPYAFIFWEIIINHRCLVKYFFIQYLMKLFNLEFFSHLNFVFIFFKQIFSIFSIHTMLFHKSKPLFQWDRLYIFETCLVWSLHSLFLRHFIPIIKILSVLIQSLSLYILFFKASDCIKTNRIGKNNYKIDWEIYSELRTEHWGRFHITFTKQTASLE